MQLQVKEQTLSRVIQVDPDDGYDTANAVPECSDEQAADRTHYRHCQSVEIGAQRVDEFGVSEQRRDRVGSTFNLLR